MTTQCKEINPVDKKRTVFQVEINITGAYGRGEVIEKLRHCGLTCMTQLADIIEKG